FAGAGTHVERFAGDGAVTGDADGAVQGSSGTRQPGEFSVRCLRGRACGRGDGVAGAEGGAGPVFRRWIFGHAGLLPRVERGGARTADFAGGDGGAGVGAEWAVIPCRICAVVSGGPHMTRWD